MTAPTPPPVGGDELPGDWSDFHNRQRDPVRQALDEVPQGWATLRVLGVPQPKGSMRAVGRSRYSQLIDANPEVGAWQQLIAIEAENAARHLGGPLTGPLGVDYTFRLRMPPSRKPVALRRTAVDGWGVPHWVTPDLDKLDRAVGDALKAGGLIRDDAQIADKASRKDEVAEGWIGVLIVVRQVAPTIARRCLG